jgi:hypothetical protein
MTHRAQTTAIDGIMGPLAEHGFDGMALAVTVPLDEVMDAEQVPDGEAAGSENNEGSGPSRSEIANNGDGPRERPKTVPISGATHPAEPAPTIM